jgi:hypothetical protein
MDRRPAPLGDRAGLPQQPCRRSEPAAWNDEGVGHEHDPSHALNAAHDSELAGAD